MPSIAKTQENILLFVFGVAGLLLFIGLFPKLQPSANIGMNVDRSTAITIAENYLKGAEARLPSYASRNVAFQANNRYNGYFKSIDASSEATDQIHEHSAPYYWIVSFVDPDSQYRYELYISTRGHVFRYQQNIPDDVAGNRLSQSDAEGLARTHLKIQMPIDWTEYTRIDANSADLEKRTDHTFTWQTHNPAIGEAHYRITATVAGDELASWGRSLEFPADFQDKYSRHRNLVNVREILQLVLGIGLWVFALFVFALRFRASEVSIRNGLIVVALLLMLFLFFSGDTYAFLNRIFTENDFGLGRIVIAVNISLQIFFTCLGLFFVWISGESHTRDLWPLKLKVIDGIFARYLMFPDLGRAILRGFSLGFIQLGLWFLTLYVLEKTINPWMMVSDTESQLLSAFSPHFYLPPVGVFSNAGVSALLSAGYAYLFSISLLKKITKRTAIAVFIPWIAFSAAFSDVTIISPEWLTPAIGVGVGLISFLFFMRYDLATIIVGGFIMTAAPLIYMYFVQAETLYVVSAVMGIMLLSGLFVFGWIARIKGVPLHDAAIEPAYARNISERQRLKLELDIARRAQLQMLPQRLPDTRGLDIAALSEPARQVGGDYYDFFHLSEDLLGFAVGDVSGKGMPAALYMTLLKGSLQSGASASTTPKKLLSHINRTFFRSAERTTFVTLLYGVIDLNRGLLTFARAGHNPVLIFRQHGQEFYFLKPPGLGIGLEKGDVFDRTLAEESFALKSGDTIVLFTDGLTEARNAENEEFGEDRLTALIKSKPFHTAEELLDRIRAGYNLFTSRADPHDDLTCLVIRYQ